MLVHWAGNYEFCACMHGGWTVYLCDMDMDAGEPLGHWDTLDEAHKAVGAPAWDEEDEL